MTGQAAASPFGPEVVAAVCRHMNDDHADDTLLIVRALGGRPDASAARMTGLDAQAAVFEAVGPDGGHQVRVPWSGPVTERPQIRREVVRMYREACERLGVPPRGEGEH
ncbi:DUF2470 domain-containing protein [Allonocardiopsis opalescens]|uniref:Uncharacterized protein DUF2470 n=1 Tax=Allonocardiopsis opalescens TaxID=1144618 RepID=A0A2T0Q3S3_9ACTN|nr:DUF2470 domain-containing protein [Allonocardiopsis opalescens]PRX98456.1 uncharacterized protein DUF2470 [Allonocardiopsis opalescens]